MNTNESQKVVARFFNVLNELVALKRLRGRKTFCDLYGIDRRNLHALSRDYASDRFQVCWLTYLVRDFGVSPKWLLTGLGEKYTQIVEQSLNTENNILHCTDN